jgi:Mn-dependent DtxR family transcriptional regulator
METLKEESWIGTKEAAQYLGVKPATNKELLSQLSL